MIDFAPWRGLALAVALYLTALAVAGISPRPVTVAGPQLQVVLPRIELRLANQERVFFPPRNEARTLATYSMGDANRLVEIRQWLRAAPGPSASKWLITGSSTQAAALAETGESNFVIALDPGLRFVRAHSVWREPLVVIWDEQGRAQARWNELPPYPELGAPLPR